MIKTRLVENGGTARRKEGEKSKTSDRKGEAKGGAKIQTNWKTITTRNTSVY